MYYKSRLHSLRLPDHDYSTAGLYFVTVCLAKGVRLRFGKVREGEMVLNAAGEIVEKVWLGVPGRFAGVFIDAYVVMPDHFHGILGIAGGSREQGEGMNREGMNREGMNREGMNREGMNREIRESPVQGGAHPVGAIHESPIMPPDAMPPDAMPPDAMPPDAMPPDAMPAPLAGQRRQMVLPKVMGYFKMNAARKINQQHLRSGRLWHRGYYDRILRDAPALHNVRRYIQQNPANWRR